jgi:hypothetical protein
MRVTIAACPPDPCRAALAVSTGLAAPSKPDRTLDLAAGQVGFTDLDLSRLQHRSESVFTFDRNGRS